MISALSTSPDSLTPSNRRWLDARSSANALSLLILTERHYVARFVAKDGVGAEFVNEFNLLLVVELARTYCSTGSTGVFM